MVIGHNPGLKELARRLSGQGSETARKLMASKYQAGALAVIGISGTGRPKLDESSLERFVRPP